MGLITGGTPLDGGGVYPILNAGAPVDGTSEIVNLTVTGTPTGGTFKLAYLGTLSADIAYNASAPEMQAALEAIPTIGTGNVTVSGTAPYACTFAAELGKRNVDAITLAVNSLTGGTAPSVTVAVATPGVDATGRGAAKGTLLIDTTNGALYINTGTAAAPTWSIVGNAELAALMTAIPATTVAAVATADSDATYGAAESTLINEMKTQLNLVIARLKTVGILASS